MQQLLFGGFQVRQEANLLKNVRCEVLCLVDDQYGAAPVGVRVEQVVIQCVDQRLDAAAVRRHCNTKFLADRDKEFTG